MLKKSATVQKGNTFKAAAYKSCVLYFGGLPTSTRNLYSICQGWAGRFCWKHLCTTQFSWGLGIWLESINWSQRQNLKNQEQNKFYKTIEKISFRFELFSNLDCSHKDKTYHYKKRFYELRLIQNLNWRKPIM